MSFVKNRLSKRFVIIIILLICVFSIALIAISYLKDREGNESVIPIANASVIEEFKKENIPLPVRLKIPKINVDATIEYVGLNKDGSVGVPKGPKEVAWFDLGPRPGEIGSSVIDGHSGWRNNIKAVFDNLYKLKIGDKVYVEDEKGIIITFLVREIKIYKPNETVPNVFSSDDNRAHLNLITCTGFWNKILKSHSNRLVVFTDKE